ncbi:MAG: PDZ domain-containing protein [Clostridia bacterium]|nr:PDZ domain-containing protein [Clostridia bacterium]
MKVRTARKKNKLKNVIIVIIILTVLTLISIYLYYTYQNIDINNSNYETQRTQSTINKEIVEKETKNSTKVADILEETMKSVVGISKLKDNGASIFSNNNETSLGLGTGMIVSENGYILSNEHVTGGKYSTCYVTLENGSVYDGTVVWSDSDLDLSITKIEVNGLKYITLGDSNKIRIGETVYAIGNPIGFEFRRTVTSGIISSKNRTIKLEEGNNVSYMSDLIQTDATINPGNSGGPLIYPNGEIIGINTVKISSAEGIGFAIPINVVKPVINTFIEKGNFEQATLGVYAYDKEVIPYLNKSISFGKGIYVAQIVKNGPASHSELKEGDIIVSIDGNELNNMNDLRTYLYSKKPNDMVSLQISRGKINKNLNIILR